MTEDERRVENDRYNEANTSVDNVKLMRSVVKKYRKSLNIQEMRECMEMALLKTIRTHEDWGSKFTTSLGMRLHWECRNAVRDKRRSRLRFPSEPLDDANEACSKPNLPEGLALEVCESVKALPKELRTVVQQYFFLRMSFREIAKANSYSYVKSRYLLRRAVDRLKRIHLGVS